MPYRRWVVDLRVAFISEWNSLWGGGEMWEYNLARELMDLGVQVIPIRISTPAAEGPLTGYTSRFLYMMKGAGRAREVDDVHIVHSFKMFTPMLARVMLPRRPMAVTIHDVYGIHGSRAAAGGIAGIPRWMAETMSTMVPGSIYIVPSISTARRLNDVGVPMDRIRVVGAGVNLRAIDGIEGDRSRDPEIAFLGRLVPHKHPEVVVRLAAELGVRAHMIGEGHMMSRLERLAIDLDAPVTFHGHVDEREKYEVLKRSWALVMPSTQEGYGLAIIEAMACGTPPIAYDSGGPAEIIRDGENGFLIPTGDYDLLKRAVEMMIEDPGLVESMGSVSRRDVERGYTWRRVAIRVLRSYDEILRGG